jgi:hypothetical protein
MLAFRGLCDSSGAGNAKKEFDFVSTKAWTAERKSVNEPFAFNFRAVFSFYRNIRRAVFLQGFSQRVTGFSPQSISLLTRAMSVFGLFAYRAQAS